DFRCRLMNTITVKVEGCQQAVLVGPPVLQFARNLSGRVVLLDVTAERVADTLVIFVLFIEHNQTPVIGRLVELLLLLVVIRSDVLARPDVRNLHGRRGRACAAAVDESLAKSAAKT